MSFSVSPVRFGMPWQKHGNVLSAVQAVVQGEHNSADPGGRLHVEVKMPERGLSFFSVTGKKDVERYDQNTAKVLLNLCPGRLEDFLRVLLKKPDWRVF